MADIDVERRGPSVWPWIVGLLVLALLIWALVEMFGRAGEPVIQDPLADTLRVDTPIGGPATAPAAPPADPATGSPDTLPAGTVLDTI